MPLDTSNNPIVEKLAKELYRPTPPATEVSTDSKVAKAIPLHRFQALEQQIKNNPANSEPYHELGAIYLEQARWKDARRVLEQGVRHNPEDESLLTMLEDARLRISRESMQTAARQYEWQKTEVSRHELDQSELELAALQFEIAEARYARHPDQPDLLITSAIALNRLARTDEAIRRLERAQTFPQTRAVASLNLGIFLESKHAIIEALAAYRRAIIFRSPAPPQEVRTRALELAIALSEKHELYDSAIRYVNILADQKPGNLATLQAKLVELKKLAAAQKTAPQD